MPHGTPRVGLTKSRVPVGANRQDQVKSVKHPPYPPYKSDGPRSYSIETGDFALPQFKGQISNAVLVHWY